MLLGQLVEHDDFINPVEELRLKEAFHLIHHPVLHEIVICLGIACHAESKTLGGYDVFRSRIACHDDDGILKVNLTALGIRDMTVVQHLEQDIEYVRMGLLYLIKKNH